MIAIIWHIARMLLLRSWAFGIASWMSPVGRGALLAALAIAAFIGWSALQREVGRDQERAQSAALAAEAEARALKAASETTARHTEMVTRDDAELAAIEAHEKRVRDDSTRHFRRDDSLVWRADDSWLRSKR